MFFCRFLSPFHNYFFVSFYSSITNSNGVATFNLSNLTSSATWTCSYNNVTDTCIVNVVTYYFIDDCSADNSSSSNGQYKPDNWALYSGDIAIEWENWATTYNNDYFLVTGSTDVPKTFYALYITKPCQVKITIRGTTCKSYIDGVEKQSYTINRDSNDKIKVRLQINPSGDNIKYSNFRMYSID